MEKGAELDFGSIRRTVNYRNGKPADVENEETITMMPEDSKNINLAIKEFEAALVEALAYGRSRVSCEVHFRRKKKEIRLIKLTKSEITDFVL